MTTKKCIVVLYEQPAVLIVTETRYRYEIAFASCLTNLGYLKHTDYGVAWHSRCVSFRRRPLKGKAIQVEEAFAAFCKSALIVPLQLATPAVLTDLGHLEGLDDSFDPKVRSYFNKPTVVGRHAILKRLRDKFTHVDVSNPGQLTGLRLHSY